MAQNSILKHLKEIHRFTIYVSAILMFFTDCSCCGKKDIFYICGLYRRQFNETGRIMLSSYFFSLNSILLRIKKLISYTYGLE